LAALVPSVGTTNTCNNDLGLGKKFAKGSDPGLVSENKSDMRGIKPGWYTIEDDGNLSSGPFSSREECMKRITQPTNEAIASKLQ
jgi:hypothetical protein